MVGAMFAVVAMLGLIIDGGNAWANQRIVQNGNDAAAKAGAIVMAEQIAGVATPSGGWDGAVATAIKKTAAANGISVTAADGQVNAYYTDYCGIPLKLDGTAALNADNTYDLASADRVGSGSLPTITTTTPDCPSLSVGPVAGVMVLGQDNIKTYFATLFGIHTFSINTQATAAAGYSTESPGAFLPLTIPVDILTCDGSNNAVSTGFPWVADGQTVYKVPLCSNSPGNVGWLDWTPPNGGTSELVCSILHPNNPSITFPSWQYVTSTGNVNGGGGQCSMSVEDAIRTYDGRIVTIPMFDLTCNTKNNATPPDSTMPAIKTGPLYGCPSEADLGGSGQNQWYRMPSYAHFQFCISTDPACVAQGADYGAYISGNNKSICDSGGNGATSCIVGKFVEVLDSGTIGTGVGGGTGNSKSLHVQLIK